MTEEDYDGMLGGPSTVASICALAEARPSIVGKIPQLYCGDDQPVNKIGASVDLDGGPQYMATINNVGNSSVSNTFTITANMTVDPSSISCSPADLTIELIGDGPGSFRPHQFMYPSKFDTATMVMKVTDRATQYDWMAVSEQGSGCDYLVTIHTFTIDCAGAEAQYQCFKGQCMKTSTGISKETCDQVCH